MAEIEIEMQKKKSDLLNVTVTDCLGATTDALNLTPRSSDHTAETAPHKEEPKEIGNVFEQLKDHITGSYLNALYVFVPLAFAAKILSFGSAVIFVLSFLALIPLAAALGDFTEDLALRTNEGIGALINVTFGNATELIISIVALRAGQYELIKNSLVGSVLGNMLLVLGTAFMFGGSKEKILKFNAAAAQTYMSSLVFACFGFIVPTAFFALDPETQGPAFSLAISRQISIPMILVYALYIYFQMKSHKSLFDADDDDDDDETPNFSFVFALVAIGVVAVLISLLSDYLVATVEGAAESLHISTYFIAMVLIPIVGNVAEHASAIIMAGKGKNDIAVGIALGSSIQIAMMVMPLICLFAWVVDKPLSMNITPFTCAILFAGIVLTYVIVAGGEANYLTGTKMFTAYAIIIVAFLNAPDLREAAGNMAVTAAPAAR